jgi:cell division protein FtsQ
MAAQNRRGANRSGQSSPSRFEGLMENISRLLMVVLFALVIYSGNLMYSLVDKPLTEVMVGGEFNYMQQQALAEMVNSHIEGGFLSADLNRLRQVLQEHPWVDQVSIRRQWPSTLIVEVVEEVAIARWGEAGFLNRLGEQLSIADNSALASLPVLRADFGTSKEMMESYQLLAELLLPTGLKLAELQRDDLGSWRVDTANGIRLVLGRDQIGKKIQRLVKAWESGLNQQINSIETIDLRYPNGLAVAWRDGVLVGVQQETEANTVLTAAI